MAAEAPPPLLEDHAVVPGTDGEGNHVFSLLVKRTYRIVSGKPAERAEEAVPLARRDHYWDDGSPEETTVRCESDLVPYKPRTDVVLVGSAHAPGGRPAEAFDAGLEVGEHRKRVRVLGNRVCRFREGKPPAFTDPEPLAGIELRYDYAYGGADRTSNPDLPFFYPRNHGGRGLAVANVPDTVEGLRLPNLEDPDDLLVPERLVLGEPGGWAAQPLPWGLGWFQKTWYPRSSLAGAMPPYVDLATPLREEEMGLVPEHQAVKARKFQLPAFDPRFNNGASPGLAVPYLGGDEAVKLRNLTPDGSLDFLLPGERPSASMDIGLGVTELEMVLSTVCIRPPEMEVDLVWRGCHAYPGLDWLPEMTGMKVEIA